MGMKNLIKNKEKEIVKEAISWLEKEIEESLKLKEEGKWVEGIKKYMEANLQVGNLLYWEYSNTAYKYFSIDNKEICHRYLLLIEAVGREGLYGLRGECCLEYIASDPKEFSMVHLIGLSEIRNVLLDIEFMKKRTKKGELWDKLNDENIEEIIKPYMPRENRLEVVLDEIVRWDGKINLYGGEIKRNLIRRAYKDNEKLTSIILKYCAPKYYEIINEELRKKDKLEKIKKRIDSKDLSLVDVIEIKNALEKEIEEGKKYYVYDAGEKAKELMNKLKESTKIKG